MPGAPSRPADAPRTVLVRRAEEPAPPPPWVRDLLDAAPGHQVVVFDGDLDDLHVALTVGGPYDVVVDLAGRGRTPPRLGLLPFHVRPGGRLVCAVPGPEQAGARRAVLDLVADLRRLASAGPVVRVLEATERRDDEEADRHCLAASLRGLAVVDDVVSAVVDADVLHKLPEHRVEEVLAARTELGRTVDRVPAPDAPRAPAAYRTNLPRYGEPGTGDAPDLTLRLWPAPVVLPRLVAYRDDVVLPSSFRDPVRPRLRTRWLADWAPRSVQRPAHAPPPELPGTYLHLDGVLRGHFGHALTEQLSLTWAWERARAAHPEVVGLVHTWPDHPVADWEVELLAAAGVDRLHVADGPVRPDLLLTATPAYAIGSYVHPVATDVWRRTGDALAARASAAPGGRPDRLFLTRADGKRACRQQAEVERLAVDRGYTLLRPETLPLPDQVAAVRGASVVAGFAGSALFHLALADRPVRAVVVASDTYPAHNERQICAALGHDLTLVRGRSQVRTTDVREDRFHSDYDLDADALDLLARSL